MNIDNEITHLFNQAVYANSNKKPHKYKKLFLIISLLSFIFLAGFLCCFSYFSFQTKSNLISSKLEYITISPVEKLTYKKLIKQIALKEKRHPNSIHAELRKAFNYQSYYNLTKDQYNEIYTYLQTRL